MSASAAITIPTEEFSTILGKAILDSLSEKTRETVLQGALNYLLTQPPKHNNYRGETEPAPIEYAFQKAIRELADEVAKEAVLQLKPQVQQAVVGLIEAFDAEYDYELHLKLMEAIVAHNKSKSDR